MFMFILLNASLVSIINKNVVNVAEWALRLLSQYYQVPLYLWV